MFTVTISTAPGQPGRVFGRIGLQGRGLTRDCLLAFRGRLGLFGVVRLERYAIGVEPLVGLLARLLLLIPAGDEAQARSPVSYVSVSVYQGHGISQSALREHVVARSNGVLLEVEHADEDRERRTAGAAHRYNSSVTMVGHAVCTLLWSGGRPALLQPLTTVLAYEKEVACVFAGDIPPYTRRRFLRRLSGGGGDGAGPDVFFASDWADFLSSVLAEAEGNYL
jgi:hypothetical protein